MNEEVSLESVIRQYIILPPQPSNKGWWVVKCEMCSDYKKRGAFLFDNDSTCYKCFNCGVSTTHNPSEYSTIPKIMTEVLDSFGVPLDEYKHIAFNSLKNRNKSGQHKIETDPDIKLVEIPLPEEFGLLEHAQDIWSEVAKEYLQVDRHIDPDAYPFYILDVGKQNKNIERRWRGRLIIPYYRQNTLVWYQGRDLHPKSKFRYLNAETDSECILSEYDILFNDRDKPLYICEGFFDSFMVKGVAIFGNTFKAGQIKLLNKSPREKVYIPDIWGDGHVAALQAIEQGWKVSIPNMGDAKDVNAAFVKYGKLYMMKSIIDNTVGGVQAEMHVNMLCRKNE